MPTSEHAARQSRIIAKLRFKKPFPEFLKHLQGAHRFDRLDGSSQRERLALWRFFHPSHCVRSAAILAVSRILRGRPRRLPLAHALRHPRKNFGPCALTLPIPGLLLGATGSWRVIR
jgi:hypothetical protein